MKNYISFVNDHSGSMGSLAHAACVDFNANITAIKDAASTEMLDTVVSVANVGYGKVLDVTVSNPHVLKPKTNWIASGGTPLWSSTMELLQMLNNLPDINKPDVSSLVIMTTDGEATDRDYYQGLKDLMRPLLNTGRWTFVARVPQHISRSQEDQLIALGIPKDNIQRWETTVAGMKASTQATTQAMGSYFTARSAGATSSTSFYANAAAVNLAALNDVSKKVSLYVVDPVDNGIEIRSFILCHRMEYLKGAAFYQLTKTESRVSYTKQILIRERATGKIYAGHEARRMIGLPIDRNARLHPGDHKNFDLFIQSESVNRKLVGGTGVIYWKELGTPFTPEELLKFTTPKTPVAAAPAVVQLPAVAPTNKPTKSPIPVTPKHHYFETREEARTYAGAHGIPQSKIAKNLHSTVKERRWMI